MSNRHDGTDSDTRSRRLIQDRQERLEEVLDVFTDRAADVSLSPAMKREIAVHILNYHRVLSKFEGESVLDDGDIPDVSPLRERLGQQTQVLTQSEGWDGGLNYEQRPAIDELEFGYLEAVADQLEAAAKKLGFWAEAKSQTEVFGVDPDYEEGDA